MAVPLNKNSAFSLIEILQTIILIGIIAGISISFFRSVNTDTKLRDSTEIMLYHTIREANKQMCSDATPFCKMADAGDGRVRGYIVDNPNNQINCTEGTYQNGNCVRLKDIDPCPAGTEEFIERDGTINCYSAPTCNNAQGGIGNVELLSSHICPNGIPQWNALIQRNASFPTVNQNSAVGTPPKNVTEICYRLWDLINHKRQGNSAEDDLIATCVEVVASCFATNNANNPCNGINSDVTNMILPNGVRLYNLSGIANSNRPTEDNPDGQHIYIKYDRNPLIQTHNAGVTSSMFNVVHFGKPNNLIDADDNPTVPGGSRGQNEASYIPASLNALLLKDGIITKSAE